MALGVRAIAISQKCSLHYIAISGPKSTGVTLFQQRSFSWENFSLKFLKVSLKRIELKIRLFKPFKATINLGSPSLAKRVYLSLAPVRTGYLRPKRIFQNGILFKSILFQIGQNPKYAKDVDSGYFGSYPKFGNQITILVIPNWCTNCLNLQFVCVATS